MSQTVVPKSSPDIRPNIKILCTVWGEAYVKQFADAGLASLLSTNNVPVLAKTADVEFVFLTSKKSINTFKDLPILNTIGRYAKTRFVSIDDLIVTGQYSVTLTLAFFRGVQIFGAAATGMHFIFWNADFVLADGGLAYLAKLIAEDRRLIMTGTLRALSPIADEKLAQWGPDEAGVRHFPARDLVRLALDHPQQHHAAKVINQADSWSSFPSQMFWRVGGDAILGKFFQAFMLCIRPSRVPEGINGPCDYSFMPELVPDAPLTMIENSDNFFALELGVAGQEDEFVHIGSHRDEFIRYQCMDEWLTLEHKITSDTTVTFRAAEGDEIEFSQARDEFETYHSQFMERVHAPISHAQNYYWTWGVAAWLDRQRAKSAIVSIPPELAYGLSIKDLSHPSYDRRYASMSAASQHGRAVRGGKINPNASALNIAADLAHQFEAEASKGGGLLVAKAGSLMDRHFPLIGPQAHKDVHRIEPNIAEAWPLLPERALSSALVVLTENDPYDVVRLIDNISPAMAADAEVRVLMLNMSAPDHPHWAEQKVRASLPLGGRLEGFKLDTIKTSRGQLNYEARVRRAVFGLRHDRRQWIKLWAVVKIGLALLRRFVTFKTASGAFAVLISGRLRVRADEL